MTDYTSVALNANHELSSFDCGVKSFDDWLNEQSVRAMRQGTARTQVWVTPESDKVVAYYSITPHAVSRAELSSSMAGGATTIPCYLLARLALDQQIQGFGLGGELLHDALVTILNAADRADGRLVVVDAIDDHAAKFYQKYDFQPVKDNPRRLAMKIATLRKALR
ncbi:GNAT family N-acetyltransferase [Amycolatopsis panacis]|uniref:GNAT family N-acetyltransferase n=1 Tax=Amycolatopsis panacis TaxID=2340917 RepID=A0A419I8E7_9PSEU|nr:GNAT family N-acetyltransferase [Amycolatopsis panacis]RJQ88433.1 GNAT family N-acetyltransferase [Amycolatopsis panacis]